MILDRNYLQQNRPSYIDEIYLNNMKITNIKPGTFVDLPELVEIDLSSNQITSIKPETFGNLPELEEIYLSSNQITSIEPETFVNLPSLEVIVLLYNQITSIKPETFVNLPSLGFIDLRRCQITSIEPRSFVDLPLLEVIDLFDNQITSIEPRTFVDLPKLKEIDLSDNQITSIEPETFVNLPSLEFINLDKNPINIFSNIPSNIRILSIDNQNIINRFLSRLEQTYISDKNITSIYDIISSYNNLRALKRLYPEKNQIYSLFSDSNEKIKNLAKRIQLLADIANLKTFRYDELNEADKMIKNTYKKSIAELEQSRTELETVTQITHTSVLPEPNFKNIPKELRDFEISSFLGGSYNDKLYKDKYIKYKNKYIELKNKINHQTN